MERLFESFRRSTSRLWIAAGLVATLPALTLWVFDELVPRPSSIGVELYSEAIARRFSPVDSTASRLSATKMGIDAVVATDSSATSLPGKAAVPPLGGLESAPSLPLSAATPTATRAPILGMLWLKFWHQPETTLALTLYLGVVGVALILILSATRPGSSSFLAGPVASPPDPLGNDAVGGADGKGFKRSIEGLSRDLQRLAEQVRLDVGNTVHDMRSPLGAIIGSLDMLRREIPGDAARAQRALQLADKATGRLSAVVDGSWHTGNALASLVLAPRRREDLGRVLLKVTGDRLSLRGRRIQCCVVAECPVSAPEGVLALALDGLLQHLHDLLPATSSLFASAACDGEEVHLEISASAAATFKWDISQLVPRDTARTISLLGGRLEATSTGDDLRSIRLALPRCG